MKVNYVLLISLLIVGTLLVPAVSADEIIVDTTYTLNTYTETMVKPAGTQEVYWGPFKGLLFTPTYDFSKTYAIQWQAPSSGETAPPSNNTYITLKGRSSGQTYGYADYGYFRYKVGKAIWVQYYIQNIVWVKETPVASDYTGSGVYALLIDVPPGEMANPQCISGTREISEASIVSYYGGKSSTWIAPWGGVGGAYTNGLASTGNVLAISKIDWANRLLITRESGTYFNYDYITVYKDIAEMGNSKTRILYDNGSEYIDDGDTNTEFRVAEIYRPYTVAINNYYQENWYNITIGENATPTDPGDPGDAILRTGTVTMTDHNGTSITGFEVTAVNHYTGQSYNVSTETDVAVMTLPMDRTISMRNPQTGEYEEAPIGYYRFYGQSPGYKMLVEEGIQVAVMPEKYGSYQLCNILVTSESGPLTGKHKFQIRSRSDNSILQTGTVSAKSATTNQWYNTTVSDGIATLILAYDTSNPISQYAGNYYVYATSPGYMDSDYGTQIVVMPQTVSEIRTILLTPIGGIPPAGNVTLRIQAFSEYGPGVPNASIFIAGVNGAGSSVWDTYTASSTGYLTVSVPGNSTYDIVASGDGYYDSARRITVYTDDPPLIEIKLYLSGPPTVEPTTQPTGWPTTQPTTPPTGGIPDKDDGSEGFLMEAVRGIGLAFGVGFATAKLIFGMLLALSIGYTTAKQLRGGAAEFGLGLLGGTLLGVLIGLLPVWIIVVLLLVVGMYIGYRYVGGGNNG